MDEDELAHRINATNPSKIEMMLALEPGGPESLEEASARVVRGEPVIAETGQTKPEEVQAVDRDQQRGTRRQ